MAPVLVFAALAVYGSLQSQRADDSPKTVTLITNVINLAHSLRLDVVAEGVEDEEQAKMLRLLRLLRLLRCDQLQGYLLGSPMPAGAFGTTLLGR